MNDDIDALRQEVASLSQQVSAFNGLGVRRRSQMTLFGLPLYDIATGPDIDRGEVRGRARGIVAIGDVATGLLAIGGFARGVVAVGGLAMGIIAVGGCSLGLLLAFGGLAIGTVALGGGAIGYVAVGGGAIGFYACGGGAFGQHVISAAEQSPEAVKFFESIPWLPALPVGAPK